MNIENPNTCYIDTRCLCVPMSFELNHSDPQDYSQTRDEIYRNIIVIKNRNYETCEYVWKFLYYDKKTGIRAEHTAKMDALKYEEALKDGEELHNVHRQLDSIKQSIVGQVIAEHKKRYFAEALNMNSKQFDNLYYNIRRVGGTITLQADSINRSGTVMIEVPTYYLNRLNFDVQDQKKNSWIEGLPAVEKVETYNDRVVKVTFVDGTFTKAVCSENDHFDLDVGITVCAMKRMLGEKGNQYYNDFIRHAHKVIVENDKKKEAEAREKAEARMKRRKAELKKAAKKLKAKEEQIDIHKQAIIRAHAEMEGLE